ncbi:MAG: ferredoxin--NADP reductase [Verrucomicrobiota bacterium]
MSASFQTLKIRHTERETSDALSVYFETPGWTWKPGQHITLRRTIKGEEVRRCYSISSSPFTEDGLRITVKRVKGGRMSNHINDHVEPDGMIDVMPPSGGFHREPDERARRTAYFFGAGSGVTPLFSMIQSLLIREPNSFASLLVGNRRSKDILFRDTLAALQAKHPDRFTVRHTLSRPGWSVKLTDWVKGRVDEERVQAFIHDAPPYAQDAHYYICGPGGMNQTVERALMGIDVPENRIFMESYGGDSEEDESVAGMAARVNVRLGDDVHEVGVAEGQTLLEAMKTAGLNPPHSCEAGLCGACRAQLGKGSVHMRNRMALMDDEIEAGAILTCQAVPTETSLSIDFS